jgi:hypothetical protein
MAEQPVKFEEMTPEAASALEREVILHAGDPDYRLPDGRTVAQVREAQARKDEADRKEAAEFWERSVRANTPTTATVAVRTLESGVLVTAPAKVQPAETEDVPVKGDAPATEAAALATPLPEGFPQRELLEGAGFSTVEKVRAASDEELVAIDGIAEGRLAEVRKALKKLK